MIAILCHTADFPAGRDLARAVKGSKVFDETTAHEAHGAAVVLLVLSADAYSNEAMRAVFKAAHEAGTLRFFAWRRLFMAGMFGLEASGDRLVGKGVYPRSGEWVFRGGSWTTALQAAAVEFVRAEQP